MININTNDNKQIEGSRLKDMVALITGGGTGIGAATAALFAKEGASVMITGMKEAPLKNVVNDIQSRGGNAMYTVQDVSREEDWKEVVNRLIKQFGKIDILVNNAGITGDTAF